MSEHDHDLRLAALAHCVGLQRTFTGIVPWPEIKKGFQYRGEKIFLGSTPRGIHRPTQMTRGVLSIKTTVPKDGRVSRYRDDIRSDGLFTYSFQGDDPTNRDNRALREAFEDGSPIIYFLAISPGLYQILFPCFIASWDEASLSCAIAVGDQDQLVVPGPRRVAEAPERAYTTVLAKVRLHQTEFRHLVLTAYERRCAISGLPLANLLDAAHIIPDRDERGKPEIPNGLCLSTLHHSAFDCNLLGIDPDGIVQLSPQVLNATDGPTLEALKEFHGRHIRLPRHTEDHPNRDYLALRFEEFRKAI
ncbi:MAG: HNH endonuclease [Planctomycetes bacterium]|nr:HNH endonuclease [Planctomycetota bacterium]